MYNVFDSFLNRPFWHTGHAQDDEAFYQALSLVIDDQDFAPDDMGDYFRTQKGGGFEDAIDRLVASAVSVRDYIDATH